MNLRQILALFIAQGIDQQIIHEPVNRPGVPTFLNDQKANRRAPVFSSKYRVRSKPDLARAATVK